jgi:acyl-CoA thioester hydrolase
MTAVPYDYPHTVTADEIDVQHHANNVAYVQWMQDAAVAHSAALGWPIERYFDRGWGWVARSHAIVYRQPAFEGDRLVIRTWVATMKRVTSLRRYRILRLPEETLLAEAETQWAFVDFRTGLPVRVPQEIAEAYRVVTDVEFAGAESRLKLPTSEF